MVIQADGDDLLQELVVRKTGMRGGVGEIFVFSDLWIWVGFKQIKLALLRQPIVETGVTAKKKVAINTF